VDSNPKPSCFGINRQAAKSHLLQPPHPLSLPISFSHALPLPLPSRPTSLLLTLSLYPAAPPLSFSRFPSTQLPHLSPSHALPLPSCPTSLLLTLSLYPAAPPLSRTLTCRRRARSACCRRTRCTPPSAPAPPPDKSIPGRARYTMGDSQAGKPASKQNHMEPLCLGRTRSLRGLPSGATTRCPHRCVAPSLAFHPRQPVPQKAS
jgi:hypothetical protein